MIVMMWWCDDVLISWWCELLFSVVGRRTSNCRKYLRQAGKKDRLGGVKDGGWVKDENGDFVVRFAELRRRGSVRGWVEGTLETLRAGDRFVELLELWSMWFWGEFVSHELCFFTSDFNNLYNLFAVGLSEGFDETRRPARLRTKSQYCDGITGVMPNTGGSSVNYKNDTTS